MAKIKQATKKTGRQAKETIVAELVEKLDNSNGLVFTNYQGLTHKQLEDLKKELKKLDSTMVIAKNSLLRLSLEKSQKFADFKDNEELNLPTATLFIQGDMIEPLKKVQRAIKEFGLPKIKFGILEGQVLDELEVIKIASLPSRTVLIAQFIGTLNSPIQGLVTTLNGTIQKFVMTLDAISKNKSLTAPAQPTVETLATTKEPVSEPSSVPAQTDQIEKAPEEETTNNQEAANTEEVKNEGGEN